MDGQRLPASYANFYIANGVVLVPTFNDPNDRTALTSSRNSYRAGSGGDPRGDFVWGLGTLHCLTQQQPAPTPTNGVSRTPKCVSRTPRSVSTESCVVDHRLREYRVVRVRPQTA